jgi:rRNA maturation protein Nop10
MHLMFVEEDGKRKYTLKKVLGRFRMEAVFSPPPPQMLHQRRKRKQEKSEAKAKSDMGCSTDGAVTISAHPSRFSPDDVYSVSGLFYPVELVSKSKCG